jgi:hypothetical protein
MKSPSPDREYRIGLSAWMVAYVALLMLSILIIRAQSPQGLPDGHPKLLHLWPPKLPQAGRPNYQLFGLPSSDLPSR